MVTAAMTENEVLPDHSVKHSRWLDNFFRPLLITIMILCFNISLVNLVRVFNPDWRGIYFLIGMLLTTVEAIYSHRVLRLWHMRGIYVLRYRLAEWAVLILILKILNFAGKPLTRIWAELQGMGQDPLNNLVDIEFFILLILAFIAWLAATNTMADFEDLHDPYTFRYKQMMPLDNLASRFFWGGIFLVFISGVTQWISRAGASSLVDFQRPSLAGIILNVLVYFTLGLVLLSQTHLTTLLVSWNIQKITVASDLVKQWAKYGLLFLGLITLVAFFLPTSYTMGFLTSAAIVIQYLIAIIILIYELFLLLILLPVAWLFSLLGQAPEESLPSPAPPPVLPGGAPEVTPIPWLEAIRSLVFWLVAMGMIWYLVKIYLNDHPGLYRSLKDFKLVSLVIYLLRQLWQQLAGLVRAGLDMMPIPKIAWSDQAGDNAASGRRWSWFGLRRLPARERIRYYYLNILKRTEKSRLARKGHQTPYEYEPDLSQAVPDVETEVNALTQIFVQARYSREDFEKDQVSRVKQQWQRVRRALKELRSEERRAKSEERGAKSEE